MTPYNPVEIVMDATRENFTCDSTLEQWRTHPQYQRIKLSTLDSLDRYANHHVETGGFLRAALENDLMEAMGRADEENRAALFEICLLIYNELPSSCHGSPAKVAAWLGETT